MTQEWRFHVDAGRRHSCRLSHGSPAAPWENMHVWTESGGTSLCNHKLWRTRHSVKQSPPGLSWMSSWATFQTPPWGSKWGWEIPAAPYRSDALSPPPADLCRNILTHHIYRSTAFTSATFVPTLCFWIVEKLTHNLDFFSAVVAVELPNDSSSCCRWEKEPQTGFTQRLCSVYHGGLLWIHSYSWIHFPNKNCRPVRWPEVHIPGLDLWVFHCEDSVV